MMANTHSIEVSLNAKLLGRYQRALWEAEYRTALLIIHRVVIADLESKLAAEVIDHDYDVRRMMQAREALARLEAKLAAVERERDALRCCGNCGHLWCEVDSEGWYLGCREQQREVEQHTMPMRTFDPEPADSCHFTPSRWTARS